MKGCVLFGLAFVLGIGLMLGGLAYDLAHSGMGFEDSAAPADGVSAERRLARTLEIGGLVVTFAAIYGAAGWRFYLRWKQRDQGSPKTRGPRAIGRGGTPPT